MNESTLFQGTVVFTIGNVDPKVSPTGTSQSTFAFFSLSLESSKFNKVEAEHLLSQ